MAGPVPMGGPGGVVTAQSPPFTLPIRYMLLGVTGFVVFALDLVAQSMHLGIGDALSPQVVALTHLLTLASLLAFVMGAVYQLSTVAFLVPVRAVPWARWNFWLYVMSIAGLIGSMAPWWVTGLITFGSLTTLSLCLYAVIIVASVIKAEDKSAMLHLVAAAHVYLILAVLTALTLILSSVIDGLGRVLPELLGTHILLATGGFFTLLMMGFSFKLLPMFTLSHGFSTTRQKWTPILCHIALWVAIAGIWTHLRWLFWIAAVFAVAAFVQQLSDVRGILKKRMRKRVEPPIQTVVASTALGLVGILVFAGQLWFTGGIAGWQTVVTFYLLGWITFTVMGYSYKIVPFLIWSKRYSRRTGEGKVPLISDLLNLKLAKPVFLVFGLGTVILTVCAGIPWAPGTVTGCVLIAVAVLAYTWQLYSVIQLRVVAREMSERE